MKEHGLVRQAYEKAGITMYEVWVPLKHESLAEGQVVSNWVEAVLKPSNNALLKLSPYKRPPVLPNK